MLTEDLVWSVHQWAGAIALAGTVGWLLSYAFVPPRGPLGNPDEALDMQ